MKDTLPSTSLLPEHLAYFDSRKHGNSIFWACLGGRPSFQDRTVIDLGWGTAACLWNWPSPGPAKW